MWTKHCAYCGDRFDDKDQEVRHCCFDCAEKSRRIDMNEPENAKMSEYDDMLTRICIELGERNSDEQAKTVDVLAMILRELRLIRENGIQTWQDKDF